jgi:glycine/D-amino acid oxidase-like deaminating enzyme
VFDMVTEELEVAVVGGGIVGLAVTDALARRGADVRCFEPARPGHAQSGGLTRVFRHRHDDERLVALAVEAGAGWRRWEERAGRRLLGSEGCLFAGATAADAAALERHGAPHRWVDGDGQRAALGVVEPIEAPVLLDDRGGAIRARRAIETLLGWIRPHLVPAEILGVTVPPRGGVQLQAGDRLYRARRAVVCAGAATARLAAGAGLAPPVAYGLHARPAFRIRERFRDAPLACWLDRSADAEEHVYSTPVGTSGRYVVGLAGADGDVPLAGDVVPAGIDMGDHVRRVAGYVRRRLPGLDPEPESVRLCLATTLPEGRDAFAAWQAGGVTALAGNNLFKFAPVLGELLAEATETDRLPEALAPRYRGFRPRVGGR